MSWQMIFILICLARLTFAELKLEMLHAVFRHGDKVPHKEFQNYPNDPYRDHSYLPYDDGDLTNEGKMREYKIGLMLRDRYNTYFGPDYWPSLIYAQTTSVKRTKMSMQLVLAGLFPPSEKLRWNPHLAWSPVDFVYMPYLQDYILFPEYCPNYQKVYAGVLQSNEVKERVRKYKNVMGYLTHHSGKLIADTDAVNYLYNLLKEEANQNLTLPLWTKKVFPHPMSEITRLDFSIKSHSTVMKRVNGGALLRRMVEEIKLVRDKKLVPKERKASLFAGHEHNIAAFSRTLGIKEGSLPEYGSTIILETLVDETDTYYIRVLYWNGITERLTVQTIPGCSNVCPLDEFLFFVKDFIPNDNEYFCHGKEENYDLTLHSGAYTVVDTQALTVLSFSVALLIVQKLILH